MKKSLLIIVIVCLTIGCKNPEKEMETQGNFAHTVFFWLKNPNNESDRGAFEKSLTYFIKNSQFIKTRHIGVPAATSRDVIDHSYTYSLLLTFENKADQDQYQEEPLHKKFIEESSHLWEKVLVYDSENILQ